MCTRNGPLMARLAVLLLLLLRFTLPTSAVEFISFTNVSPSCGKYFDDIVNAMQETHDLIAGASAALADGTAHDGRVNRMMRVMFKKDYVVPPYGAGANRRDSGVEAIRRQYSSLAGIYNPQTAPKVILMCGDQEVAWVTSWQNDYRDGTKVYQKGSKIDTNKDRSNNAISGAWYNKALDLYMFGVGQQIVHGTASANICDGFTAGASIGVFQNQDSWLLLCEESLKKPTMAAFGGNQAYFSQNAFGDKSTGWLDGWNERLSAVLVHEFGHLLNIASDQPINGGEARGFGGASELAANDHGADLGPKNCDSLSLFAVGISLDKCDWADELARDPSKLNANQ